MKSAVHLHLTLQVFADTKADKHLLALACEGKTTAVQLGANGGGYYSAECVVTETTTITDYHGSGRTVRVHKLKIVDGG